MGGMANESLAAVLEAAGVKSGAEGWSLADGRALTLHVARDGVGLQIARVEAVVEKGALVRARTQKGEEYVFFASDVFAVLVEAPAAQARKAGFV